jgi:hypothetical protein
MKKPMNPMVVVALAALGGGLLFGSCGGGLSAYAIWGRKSASKETVAQSEPTKEDTPAAKDDPAKEPKEKPPEEKKPKPIRYKTPQECFDASEEAGEKGDFKTAVACLSPGAQKDMAAGFAIMLSGQRTGLAKATGKGAEEARKALKPAFAVLDKHGVTEKAAKDLKESKNPKENEKARKAALDLIDDPVAFLIDLLEAMKKLDGGSKGKDRVTDVKITAETATGTSVSTSKGREKREPVTFVLLDGGWRLIPHMEPPPEEPLWPNLEVGKVGDFKANETTYHKVVIVQLIAVDMMMVQIGKGPPFLVDKVPTKGLVEDKVIELKGLWKVVGTGPFRGKNYYIVQPLAVAKDR